MNYFITAANARFFYMCLGLVLSIKRQTWPNQTSICILDVGLTKEQHLLLESLVNKIVIPDWDFPKTDFSSFPIWYRAMTARPHLPKYFPGAEVYVWIDADAWVQSWSHIEKLIESAQRGRLSIIEERYGKGINLNYQDSYGKENSFIITAESVKKNITTCYHQAFGPEIAAELGHIPSFNVGLFALRGDSQAWDIWRNYLQIGLKNGFNFFMEQQALNVAIRRKEIEIVNFPTDFNYLCTHGLPEFDTQIKKFVTPYENKDIIGLLHLADLKWFAEVPIRRLPDNSYKQMPLQYISLLANSII